MLRRVWLCVYLAVCLLVVEPAPTVHAAPAPDPTAVATGQPPAFDCTAVTEIPQSECEALVALYTSTSGPGWSDNTDWLQTAKPCSWRGVSCESGHVSSLFLAINWLDGLLPPEVGDLVALQIIYLPGNSLRGSLPPELRHLITLKHLDLQHNQFSGPIPPELGILTTLQYLDLSFNHLSGPIPLELGNLANLGDLYLNANHLSGPIPPELGNLTNIQMGWSASQTDGVLSPPPNSGYLDLSSNQFSGTIPVELSKLDGAAGIGLGCNQLRGSLLPEVGRVIRWGAVDYNLLSGYAGAISL